PRVGPEGPRGVGGGVGGGPQDHPQARPADPRVLPPEARRDGRPGRGGAGSGGSAVPRGRSGGMTPPRRGPSNLRSIAISAKNRRESTQEVSPTRGRGRA